MRLSKLQKKILLTLFEESKPGTYQQRRSGLIFKIYAWQEYNKYTDYSGYGEVRLLRIPDLENGKWNGKTITKGYPPQYHKKQATFTRSLQLLAGDGLVDLLGRFDNLINIYSKTAGERIGVKYEELQDVRIRALESYKVLYNKEREQNSELQKLTFVEWFKKPIRNFVGEWTSHASVYKENNDHRLFRNISQVRLTPNGVVKAKELLKVKSRIPLPKLTLRIQTEGASI